MEQNSNSNSKGQTYIVESMETGGLLDRFETHKNKFNTYMLNMTVNKAVCKMETKGLLMVLAYKITCEVV